eukprot:scaffold9878_cov45-Attheya_sp.AAC.3
MKLIRLFLFTVIPFLQRRVEGWSYHVAHQQFGLIGGIRKGTQQSPLRLSSSASPVVSSGKEQKLTREAQELEDILKEKEASGILLLAQTAPSVRVTFSEEFGLPPGAFPAPILVASLKALGFDLVMDTNTGADLTICEEGTELLRRILLREEQTNDNVNTENTTSLNVGGEEHLPMFTSCCPGWMFFVEKSDPDIIPFLSTCKSPHMMLAAICKRYSADFFGRDPSKVHLVSIMPCLHKRSESDQAIFMHAGVRDVDNVITTKDLGDLLRMHHIDPNKLYPVPFDSPFQIMLDDDDEPISGLGSGAGQLFGASGGVMEASVRSVYEFVTGTQLPRLEMEEVRGMDGLKEATVSLYNEETGKGLKQDLRVAVVNGLGNAKNLIKAMRDGKVSYDFVEVMACPAGCVGGGGNPNMNPQERESILQKRLESIYKIDRNLPIRRSHENPIIKRLYERYLGDMGGPEAHKLLHNKQVYELPQTDKVEKKKNPKH